MFPKKLQKKLEERSQNNSLRTLGTTNNLIDFSSNDYLGFSSSEKIFHSTSEILKNHQIVANGATGSRLLSGNHELYKTTEDFIASFHKSEAALVFNSGYDANIGLFSSIPQRGDFIYYDELCHASIRDGIGMSNAKSYKFKHNNLSHLKELVERNRDKQADVYVATESVFSMDGDCPDLKALSAFCVEQGIYLIVDEAHALGVFGEKGAGLVQELGLEKEVFARVVTFGKALGCHGAVVLGGNELKVYLTNFARSLIYTTALSPHSLATIGSAYRELLEDIKEKQKLHRNIAILQFDVRCLELHHRFIPSRSAIHCCMVPGNNQVKKISEELKTKGFDVKPILSPTVPAGKERLRICIHSYNNEKQIKDLLLFLSEIEFKD